MEVQKRMLSKLCTSQPESVGNYIRSIDDETKLRNDSLIHKLNLLGIPKTPGSSNSKAILT